MFEALTDEARQAHGDNEFSFSLWGRNPPGSLSGDQSWMRGTQVA
jgi:hypothetical protein